MSNHDRSNFISYADGSTIDQISTDADIVVISFGRKNIELGLTGDALDRLLSISDTEKFFHQLANKVTFQFEGYASDRREIWEIPECATFFRKLTAQWPYWFHFLEKEGSSFSLLFHLLCDMGKVQIKNGQVGCEFVDPDEFGKKAMNLFDGMNTLYEHYRIDESKNEQMTEKVNAAFLSL